MIRVDSMIVVPESQLRILRIAVVLLLFPWGVTSAQSVDTISVNAVVQLVAGKLPKSLIISKLQNSPNTFDITVAGLVRLQEQKLPADIIRAIVNARELTLDQSAVETEVLNNTSVVNMVAAKLPKDIVLWKIRNTRNRFDASANGLVQLKSSKVPDDVIRALMAQPSEPVASEDAVPEPQEKAQQLRKCTKPIATLAVVEPGDSAWVRVLSELSQFKLNSPVSLIRMMVQQSGCFTVVERGQSMKLLMQERELAKSGASGGKTGMQLKAADYLLTPNIITSNADAGGVSAVIGKVVGRKLGIGGVGMRFKEAQTSLLLIDAQTGVQVAAAEGRSKATDFGLGLLGLSSAAGAAVGGYTNTSQGKVIASSFLANLNAIIQELRPSAPTKSDGAARRSLEKWTVGDVLIPRLNGVRVLGDAADNAKVVANVGKQDELVFGGDEKNGYVRIEGAAVEGWVKRSLLRRP